MTASVCVCAIDITISIFLVVKSTDEVHTLGAIAAFNVMFSLIMSIANKLGRLLYKNSYSVIRWHACLFVWLATDFCAWPLLHCSTSE